MYLVEIDREGDILAAVGPQERLRANDRLVFVGIVESVVDLRKIRGLKPATDQVFKLNAPRAPCRFSRRSSPIPARSWAKRFAKATFGPSTMRP